MRQSLYKHVELGAQFFKHHQMCLVIMEQNRIESLFIENRKTSQLS